MIHRLREYDAEWLSAHRKNSPTRLRHSLQPAAGIDLLRPEPPEWCYVCV